MKNIHCEDCHSLFDFRPVNSSCMLDRVSYVFAHISLLPRFSRAILAARQNRRNREKIETPPKA